MEEDKKMDTRRKKKLFRGGGGEGDQEGEAKEERSLLRRHRAKKMWSSMTKGWHGKRNTGEETGPLVNEEDEDPDAWKKEKNKDPKKQKKKRKGWKRVRHAFFITCRYIGMGVAHMAPTSTYPSECYYTDPYSWYTPYGTEFNCTKAQPHWTTGLILNGW